MIRLLVISFAFKPYCVWLGKSWQHVVFTVYDTSRHIFSIYHHRHCCVSPLCSSPSITRQCSVLQPRHTALHPRPISLMLHLQTRYSRITSHKLGVEAFFTISSISFTSMKRIFFSIQSTVHVRSFSDSIIFELEFSLKMNFHEIERKVKKLNPASPWRNIH